MNNSLIVKEDDTIFVKIKNFFKKLFFNKQEITITDIPNEAINESEDKIINEFEEKIVIKEDPEEKRIVSLQKNIVSDEIKIDDISDDDFSKVVELYEKQIKALKESTRKYNESTEHYKQKIIEIRNYAS